MGEHGEFTFEVCCGSIDLTTPGAALAIGALPALAAGHEHRDFTHHIQYMQHFADRLERTGEFVDGQPLSPDGLFVRYDGEGRPPDTDGPFPETKDLIAGWMIIDVDTHQRALELAGELSAAPGAGGKPSTNGTTCARS